MADPSGPSDKLPTYQTQDGLTSVVGTKERGMHYEHCEAEQQRFYLGRYMGMRFRSLYVLE